MVTTTGYGRLYSAEGKNLWYDSIFAGTSSASPMVASAAAIVQSLRRVASGCPMVGLDQGVAFPPSVVCSLLIATGSPQMPGLHPVTEKIGPRPNLMAAISYDGDGDGIVMIADNCYYTNNPGQTDVDNDFIGDACDSCTDSDADGYGDPGIGNTCPDDNCPGTYNPLQDDNDVDGVGNACDNCINVYNPDQADSDGDGTGDACEGGCCAIRGDINHSGSGPDISDLVYLVTYMFQSGPVPPCLEEADINGSGGGPDITDLVYLVTYMFQSGPAPVACP
jgi:hypothetical protein